jgi:hypothetical protein
LLDPYPSNQAQSPKKGAAKSPGKKKDGGGKKSAVKKIDFLKLVYPECKMNNPERPPVMIFLPTKEIMQKLIKSCIIEIKVITTLEEAIQEAIKEVISKF